MSDIRRVFMTDVNYPLLPRSIPAGTLLIIRGYTPAQKESFLRQALCRRRRGVWLALSYDEALLWRYRRHLHGLHLPENVQRPLRQWRQDGLSLSRSWRGRLVKRPLPLNADRVLLSPVRPTASHPEQKALGWARALFLARSCSMPVYFLGGMPGSCNWRRQAQRLLWAGTRAFYSVSMGALSMLAVVQNCC